VGTDLFRPRQPLVIGSARRAVRARRPQPDQPALAERNVLARGPGLPDLGLGRHNVLAQPVVPYGRHRQSGRGGPPSRAPGRDDRQSACPGHQGTDREPVEGTESDHGGRADQCNHRSRLSVTNCHLSITESHY
jgi:hypothetical protein